MPEPSWSWLVEARAHLEAIRRGHCIREDTNYCDRCDLMWPCADYNDAVAALDALTPERITSEAVSVDFAPLHETPDRRRVLVLPLGAVEDTP